MRRILLVVGVGALLLWTGLGLLAWMRVGQHLATLTAKEEAQHRDETRLAALEEELGSLHQDVRALAAGLGENLQALQEQFLIDQEEHAAKRLDRIAAFRDEVGSSDDSPSSDELADLRRELQELREALRASATPGLAAQPVPPPSEDAPSVSVAEDEAVSFAESEAPTSPVPVASEPTPAVEARPRRSFLAFQLPSDDFRFDERRSWALLPALSRVGFDAKTTLHDFTATTSEIEGELEADLSRPTESPRARLSVRAAALVSSDADRDEVMREHLAVERFPTLDFELTGFEPGEIDPEHSRAKGTAAGRMTIRGVTQEVRMPVRLSIDDSRRLCVDGEMSLDLTRFEVPVPNKLGLITMEKEVRVWVSLRLRVNPRSRD